MDYERISEMSETTYFWALARTHSQDEAEELTQEIMYQALRSIDRLRDEDRFKAWFWRLADISLKVYRRQKGRVAGYQSFDDVADMSVVDDYDFIEEETYYELRRNIALMSATYRDIIVMYYYDGMTCKEISQKLGLAEGTVTYRLSAARDRLKEECRTMNETALKPAKLKLNIIGGGNFNGEDRPYPWQRINDALSQNILWHAYREKKSIEDLARLTGVPAYYIEERTSTLVNLEAMTQPTKNTFQTNFLIFDDMIDDFEPTLVRELVDKVEEEFFDLSSRLVKYLIESGLDIVGRSFDEILCLVSVMVLDRFVVDYKPTEYRPIAQKYDGFKWEYIGFGEETVSESVGIAMEKSMNSYREGSLVHHTYSFKPFTYRKMMYDHEIEICHSILKEVPIKEEQKSEMAKLIMEGYLLKDKEGSVVCNMPVLTKNQYEDFLRVAKDIYAEFLILYTDEIKSYLNIYLKQFPKHVKEAAGRNGFYVFVGMINAIVEEWVKKERIQIPTGSVCDVLIGQ